MFAFGVHTLIHKGIIDLGGGKQMYSFLQQRLAVGCGHECLTWDDNLSFDNYVFVVAVVPVAVVFGSYVPQLGSHQ